MSAPPFDLRRTARSAAAAWNEFFFSPVDARVCALLRIGFALAVLVNLACWYPDLEQWFTNAGVLPRDVVYLLQPLERWSLLAWLPDASGTIQVAFGIFLLQTVLLLVGAASRLNAVCVLVWLISFQHRNPLIGDAEDVLLRLIGWYVALMPTGRAWALDAWWRGRTLVGPPAPAWSLRLLQIQMTVILVTAGWFKLQGETWRAGTALFYVSQLDDYFGRWHLLDGVFLNPLLVRLLSWSVIAIELVVPLGLWFRQTRRSALVLVMLFHLANELTMHLFLFHWLMLLGWCSFLQPEDFAWFARRSGRAVTSKDSQEPQMNADARG